MIGKLGRKMKKEENCNIFFIKKRQDSCIINDV